MYRARMLPTPVLTMMLTAAGPATAQSPVSMKLLRIKDVGRVIPVEANAEIRIALPAHLGSGFRWQVTLQKHVRLAAPITTVNDPERVIGAPGLPEVALIRLRAPSTGSASVLLGEVRDGGGETSNSYRFRFRVVP